MVVQKSRLLLVDFIQRARAIKVPLVHSLTMALVLPSKQGKLQVFVKVDLALV